MTDQGDAAIVRLAPLAEAADWLPCLSAKEGARASALQNALVRARFIVSRGLRRQLLAECTGREAASLAFVEEPGAKPRLVGADGWDFNASHAGDLVAIVARRGPVGIDLELVRTVGEMGSIAERCFHADEAGRWRQVEEGLREEAFFILWSAREAAMKCTGVGLARGMGLTRVDTAILAGREAGAVVEDAVLSLRRLAAPPGYVMVLAEG